MKKPLVLVFLALLWACGESDPPAKPKPAPPEEETPPCEPEEIDAELICLVQGVSCGELEIEDRCKEKHTLRCGSCGEWEICQSGRCVEEPEEIDGCLLVPAEGGCADLFRVERCVEGEGGFEVVEERCGPGELCTLTSEGAACRPMSETCDLSLSFCNTAGNIVYCDGEALTEFECEQGCTEWANGPRCRESFHGTVLHQGRVLYEHRSPSADMTKWAPPEPRPASHLAVMSLSGETVLDASRVRPDGSFEVQILEEPTPQDRLIFVTQVRLLGGETAQVYVVDPQLPSGTWSSQQVGLDDGVPWSWSFDEVQREKFVITEEAGSGAVQIFQAVYATVAHVASLKGPHINSLRAVWAPGVDFDCGACFGRERGIYISGGEFQAHRSDSVLFHESGHYAFRTLGVPSEETGSHCAGVPAPPGQALSEGHASWYSADRLRDPRHYQERKGTFFVVDLDARQPAQYLAPPRPADGLTQHMNELWVSATLWRLAKVYGSSHPLHHALLAQELRTPLAGGYIGTYWWDVDEQCRPLNPVSSGIPTAIFSDFLHALLCGGFPEEPVRRHVSRFLPFDPYEPICK